MANVLPEDSNAGSMPASNRYGLGCCLRSSLGKPDLEIHVPVTYIIVKHENIFFSIRDVYAVRS